MEFYDVVTARRSVRQFTDEGITEETLKQIIEAGYSAPANDHFRDWHYIAITDKEIMKQAKGESAGNGEEPEEKKEN